MTILTDEQIEEVYIELRGTETAADIAKMFHISKEFLRVINRGEVRSQAGMSYPIRQRPKARKSDPEWPLADEQKISSSPKYDHRWYHGARR